MGLPAGNVVAFEKAVDASRLLISLNPVAVAYDNRQIPSVGTEKQKQL